MNKIFLGKVESWGGELKINFKHKGVLKYVIIWREDVLAWKKEVDKCR